MRIGYNTNGLAHHDGLEAIEVLAEIGYQSIAITVDHHLLNPRERFQPNQRAAVRQLLDDRNLRSVIETGARFLLDPRNKHQPTLLRGDRSERRRRIDFVRYCIELAAELGSDCVSLWSGVRPPDTSESEAMDRLVEGLAELLDCAQGHGVCLAFEPEPGMLIDTMERFERLLGQLDRTDLQLTLDIGHLFCQGEVPLADQIVRWGNRIRNVHLEDMRAGRHEHLMFGEGDIDFPPVVDALRRIEYSGGVHVELSRHSHEGPQAAQRAYDFLMPMLQPYLGD